MQAGRAGRGGEGEVAYVRRPSRVSVEEVASRLHKEVAEQACLKREEDSEIQIHNMSVEGQGQQVSAVSLRAELKEWENGFKAANGRRAGRDDIKKDAVIGM